MKPDAFQVANAALKYDPPSAPAEQAALATDLRSGRTRGQGAVWIMDEQGRLKALAVQVGIVGKSATEIAGQGLRAGLNIVVGLKTPATSAATGPDMPPPMFDGGGPPPPPPGK
jgi:hypothetical protein